MLMTFVDNTVDLVIAHDELTTFQSSDYATTFKVDCRSSAISLSGSSTTSSNDSFRNQISGATKQQTQQRNAQKRLSYSNNSVLSTDDSADIIVNATKILVGGAAATSAHPVESFNKKIGRTELDQTKLSRGASLNKSLALTPLYNSTEYIPVYANRVTITNTISDDEKWQILGRKRSDQLTKTGYKQLPDGHSEDITKYTNHSTEQISNDAVYALCRPHSFHQIASANIFDRNCTNESEDAYTSVTFHSPKYRSIQINKDMHNKGKSPYYGQKQSTAHNFNIEKSQTESCLTSTQNGTEHFLFQNRTGATVSAKKLRQDTEDSAKCDTTISIQINEEGKSFVEGKIFF